MNHTINQLDLIKMYINDILPNESRIHFFGMYMDIYQDRPYFESYQFSSVAQSCLTLQPQQLQHASLPCPSPTPRACSNSHPLSWWCHPTISSSVVIFSFAFNLSQHQGLSNELALCIKWPKYWSFGISPSNEILGLISFTADWFDLLAVQETLKSLVQNHSSKASILQL